MESRRVCHNVIVEKILNMNKFLPILPSFTRGCEVFGVLCTDPAGPEDGIRRGYPSRALPPAREEEGQEVHHVLREETPLTRHHITMNNNHYFSERMREETSERECALLRLLSLY